MILHLYRPEREEFQKDWMPYLDHFPVRTKASSHWGRGSISVTSKVQEKTHCGWGKSKEKPINFWGRGRKQSLSHNLISIPLEGSYCWKEDRKLTYIKLAKGTRKSLAATENRDRITEKPPSQDPGIQDLLGTEAGPGQQRTIPFLSLTMRPTSIE